MNVNIDEPKEVADFLNAWINRASSHDVEKVAAGLGQMHRTLQQSFTGFVMEFLNVMRHNESDLRNEFAVKAADQGYRAMSEVLHGATRFPLI